MEKGDDCKRPVEICVSDLLEKELHKNTEISADIKRSLEKHGHVQDHLYFLLLKRELEQTDVETPVLITGRKVKPSLPTDQTEQTHVTVINVVDIGMSTKQNGHINQCFQSSNGSIFIEDMSNNNKRSIELKEKVKLACEWLNFKHPSAKNCRPFQTTENENQPDDTNFIGRYFRKMKGGPPRTVRIDGLDSFFAFLTSFVGMLILTSIDNFLLSKTAATLVIGSFAASAVLLFAAPASPLAQPKNVLFGHLISGLVGVSVQMVLGNHYKWLAGALAVALAIYLMCLTDTVHPPGGATALIAVYSDDKIHDLLFWYVVLPVGLGALLLLITALLTNNLFPTRSYPKWWN